VTFTLDIEVHTVESPRGIKRKKVWMSLNGETIEMPPKIWLEGEAPATLRVRGAHFVRLMRSLTPVVRAMLER
jgi:hypothetical protein